MKLHITYDNRSRARPFVGTKIKKLRAAWLGIESEINLAIKFKDCTQPCIHSNRHLRNGKI